MAKSGVKVKGLDTLLKNLNKEIQKIEGNTRKGLSKAGLFIKAEAQERAPVDYGVLRNSAFSQISPVTFKGYPVVTVGFTAKYAAWVHEMPMTLKGKPRAHFGKTREGASFGGGSGKGVYWQGGENKFLEKAVKWNVKEILNIIKTEAGKDLQGK